ncbi:MAG TPA: biopolymer transporter ExbD [Pseudomonadota bacterium]|jgi:biopolymer transport protein ExbD|nr:biopolymer transporter ExbD [Deltaproteobacteria bacterium]HPH25889.1 biopolymer transporter ExbD [Pseudomonadota bacterium]
MSIQAIDRPGLMKPPAPRLRKFIPLKFVTKHGAGKKSGYAELNLTSMVDMLTILVVFLLQTFSASGELLTVSKNIQLPEAVNFKDLEQAPIIAISRDAVTLNGDPKADSAELNRENTVDWKIPGLHDDLVVLKNNFKLLHPNPEDFKGLVIVQADKNIDFKIIKKVMYSCAVAGYSNVNFAVQGKGGGGGK